MRLSRVEISMAIVLSFNFVEVKKYRDADGIASRYKADKKRCQGMWGESWSKPRWKS